MYSVLPFHVVKEFVGYATTDQDEFDDSVATFAVRSSCLSLLHICRSWREAALNVLFSKCKAQISETVYFSYCGVEKMPWQVGYLHTVYNKYVKHITMKLDYQSIVNGSAVHRLKDSWVQFPNARFLEIEFQHTEHKAENASNVTMFIPIMQHMLPAITKVYMTVSETKGHAQCVYDTSLQKLLEH
ncbi:hypothetical protein IW139_004647, partial [Coemansia sp. RSA 353]